MKTLQFLALLLCLSLTFTSQTQVRTQQIRKFRPTVTKITPQPQYCKSELSLSLKRGSVREPNHQPEYGSLLQIVAATKNIHPTGFLFHRAKQIHS